MCLVRSPEKSIHRTHGSAWVVAMLLCAIGGVGMWSVVVALPAVQAEFEVKRGAASLPYTVTLLGFAVGGVAMGRLADRFGVARPIIGARRDPRSASATWRLALATNLWQFVIAHGVLIGLLGSSTTFGPLIANTSLWFVRRRGVAVAICASGNYLAGTLWPPVVEHFIDTVGWRWTHIGIGVVLRGDDGAADARAGPPDAIVRHRRAGVAGGSGAGDRGSSRRTCCKACWRWRGWPAASRWRCRRCTSSPIAAISVMARRAGRRCCR